MLQQVKLIFKGCRFCPDSRTQNPLKRLVKIAFSWMQHHTQNSHFVAPAWDYLTTAISPQNRLKTDNFSSKQGGLGNT
jgi:hypothetical protein